MSDPAPRVVFVSGLSGSGKTTAMAALEDLGFYCVDNLPPQLIPQFIELCHKATPSITRIALAVDSREPRFLPPLPAELETLRKSGAEVELLFLDCSDAALTNRYRETRRVHPLSPTGTVSEGIERERAILTELSRLADWVVDTTDLNVHQLRATVTRHVAGRSRSAVVNLVSFGFRHGPPASAETLFDVRFLANPYFEPALRPGSGLDGAVSEYVLESAAGRTFLDRLLDLYRFLLPLYDQEGKAYLTIGVGCTGGRHRSVAVVEKLAQELRAQGREVNVEHRDVEREAGRMREGAA